MDDIVNDFLIESHEGLDQLDRDLIALEHSPTDRDLLSRIFRCVHTIKGTCGFLAFSKLESVTHVGENLLVKLRDGELASTPQITSALLALVDAIREMLASIESNGGEGDGDYSSLVARLTAIYEPPAPEAAPVAAKPAKRAAKPRKTRAKSTEPLGAILISAGEAERADVLSALHEQRTGDARAIGEILIDRGAARPAGVAEALETQAEGRSSVSDSSIRVEVALLDRLMNLVGELVLARNQILQQAGSIQASGLQAPAQRLDLLTTELQEGVMKTRMQPIGNVWSKFPRVVRDLSVSCEKQIRLEMEGADTELDKTIIEAIKDPLTHIVRNAADHGIELPALRLSRGKPAEGRLSLRAYHEGGQVIIEIKDDGAGIDSERIKQKAVEKGLISPDQAARLGAREALNLIFLPGLSTAAAVTNISGRGVGMDVVKSNIERIGGAVDIESKLGEGSLLKIKIPLTLAIIPALIVTCDGNRYAIPQVNLLELVRREKSDSSIGVEMIHGAPVYRLRGNLLPLVYARTALERPELSEDNEDALHIVVLQADDRSFGLVVDQINDTEEIVVKPMGKQLKGVAAFAGATIMGDGRVALILDVMGLAQRSNVIAGARDRSRAEQQSASAQGATNRQNLLVLGVDSTRRAAIPLSSVARLEEFPHSSVEQAVGYNVVQYRGEILPLLDLQEILGISSFEEPTGPLQVVVYSENGRRVGFVVRRIVDIVQDEIKLDSTTTREGILGSMVLQNRVTDVLDMSSIVRSAAPWLLESNLEKAA